MPRIKNAAALFVAVAALCIWGRQLWPSYASGEAVLRDTAGIVAAVLEIQPVRGGCSVLCRVENHRKQEAAQIVLNVAVVDSTGHTIASNPLISVAALAPGKIREIRAYVPSPNASRNVSAAATVSLVQWKE